MDQLDALLDTDSALGAVKVEGLVIKARDRTDKYGHVLMAKHVSPQFREVAERKKPKGAGMPPCIMDEIGSELRTEARWDKAIQHLRDDGCLSCTPRDIGALFRECSRDIEEEESEYIKQRLYQWARKGILKRATNGLAQHYKKRLADQAFTEPTA